MLGLGRDAFCNDLGYFGDLIGVGKVTLLVTVEVMVADCPAMSFVLVYWQSVELGNQLLPW